MSSNALKSKNTAVILLCTGLCLCLVFSLVGCFTILHAKKTDSTMAAKLTTEIEALETELTPLKQQQAKVFEESGFSEEYNALSKNISDKQALTEQKKVELKEAQNGKTLEQKNLIITVFFTASLAIFFFSIGIFILLKIKNNKKIPKR